MKRERRNRSARAVIFFGLISAALLATARLAAEVYAALLPARGEFS